MGIRSWPAVERSTSVDVPAATRAVRTRRRWEVFRALTAAELRDANDFTVWGFAQWLLEPVSYMLVYLVLVQLILHRAQPDYPLFLLCALIPWRYFTGVMQNGMSLVMRFSSIIDNVPTPSGTLPVVIMATEGANLLVAMLLLPPFAVASSVDAWPSGLWLLVALPVLFVLCTGPCFLGAVFGVYFPQFRSLVTNLIRGAFFLSTAFVPASAIHRTNLARIVEFNPISGIFDMFRAAMGIGTVRAFDVWYPLVVGAVLGVAGWLVYRWREAQFPKEV